MLRLSGFEIYSRWLPPIFDRKPTIRKRIHKRESKLLKQNNKKEMKNCTTHPLHKAQNLMNHPLSAPAHPPSPLHFLTCP